MSRPELHITVATGFVEDRTTLGVTHETALVKAALLYADRVTLASPRVALLASVASLLGLSEADRAEAVLQLVAALPDGRDLISKVEALRTKRKPTINETYLLRDLNKKLQASGSEMAATVNGILAEAGVSELELAIGAGVLDLDPLGINEAGGIDRVAERLGVLLGQVVAPSSTTYPLLDKSTSGMLGAMIKEGLAGATDLPRTTEPALGTRWIGAMEAFPEAEMSTILDLREALRDPLVRYRSAVINVTRRFASSPLDDDFARESAQAYREEVEPALLELRELAREKSVVSLLRREVAAGPGRKLLSAGIGLVGATATALPQLLGAAVGVGGDVVASMYSRRRDLSDAQERNGYFFLFESNRRLSQ